VPDHTPVVIAGKTYLPRKVGDQWEIWLTLIETRGEKGLFLCAPSPGYVLEQGALTDLPVLTAEERELLLEAAWSLNEVTPPPKVPIVPGDASARRPGDDFNARGDLVAVLVKHGWERVRGGPNEYWRRPGKTAGWSATLKDRVFYVFTLECRTVRAGTSLRSVRRVHGTRTWR
jgi:hypothetical protein